MDNTCNLKTGSCHTVIIVILPEECIEMSVEDLVDYILIQCNGCSVDHSHDGIHFVEPGERSINLTEG